MNILAIDTVFDKCGVAIMSDNKIVYHSEQLGKRQQTQQVLPMVDEALQNVDIKLSDLSALIFNRGPGAFSGIRINTAVIQALSVALDIPCVGISSLQVLAQAGFESDNSMNHVYAVLDARMKQVYLGEFSLQDGIMQSAYVDNHQLLDINDSKNEILLDYHHLTEKTLPLICLVTDDKHLLELHDDQRILNNTEPSAQILAKLGAYHFREFGGVPAEQALPVYLRNNAWKTLKEQGKQ